MGGFGVGSKGGFLFLDEWEVGGSVCRLVSVMNLI